MIYIHERHLICEKFDNLHSILHNLWKFKASVFSVILQKKYLIPCLDELPLLMLKTLTDSMLNTVLSSIWGSGVFTAPCLVWCTVNHTVITLYSFIQTFLPHNTLTLPLVLNLIHKEIKDPAQTKWPQPDRSCSSPISSALPEQPCEGATAH